MASEWPKHALSDLCEAIVDCPHSTPKWTDHGVIVLRNQNIKNGRLDLSSPSYTDETHYEQRSRRARLRVGDLVITREAPMGEVCMIPDGIRCCLGQRMVMLRPDGRKVIGRYLLYSLQSSSVQHEIRVNEGTGSTVSNLRIPLLKALPIPIPPLRVQHRIADVLGKLDDKIELNRRMNRTLEKMATAIFKSWFIDFDGVHAKTEGRDPGLPAEVADLFPDDFEESELGPIPKGWDVKPLDKVADYLNGLACQKHPPVEGQKSLPVIKIRELRQGITNNTDRASVDVPPKYIVEDGDVLFSWSGSLLVSIWCGGRGVLNQHVFKVTSTSFPKWYFYQATKHYLDEFQRIASDKATTMGHIKRHHLTDAKMAIPDKKLLAKGTEVLGTMLDRRINALKQARNLALTRDALLPKLLSGEIGLPQAEVVAEEVAS